MPSTLTVEQQQTVMCIIVKLAQLGHEVSFMDPVTTGPLITTFRFMPRAAAKVAQISNCADDLALALHVENVLVRRLPGEGVIGVSVPNATRMMVYWRDLCTPPPTSNLIPLNFGVDSEGKPFVEDLTMLPHLMIAGSTNGGKSVLLKSIIASLMLWRTPSELQFVMSDTKNVEFMHFVGSPHLMQPICNTKYETWEAMDKLTDIMEDRLRVIGKAMQSNIADFNRVNPHRKMPYVVFIIDELADVMGGDKRGEAKIAADKLGRIVFKARAAGVHVIAATQRPSVDTVKGSIKANFPARVTFRLPSGTDSRTVIDQEGAQHLIKQGDMLYYGPNHTGLKRLHSGYAAIEDIQQCVAYSKAVSDTAATADASTASTAGFNAKIN